MTEQPAERRTEKQKMVAGELYHAGDAELRAERAAAAAWMARYNGVDGLSGRAALLRELLDEVGDGAAIRPPFYCDYGYNIRLGAEAFLNFNCVILDVTAVVIGARTQIGPAVQIMPPTTPGIRRSGGMARSSAARSGSGRTCGSAAARSSCPASRSATAP